MSADQQHASNHIHALAIPCLVVLLLAGVAHAEPLREIGPCKITWSNDEPLDVIAEKQRIYEDCAASYAAEKRAEARLAQGDAAATVAAAEATAATGLSAMAGTAATNNETKAEDQKKFLGFDWGVGFGAAFGRGDARISEAEIVDGIVRVKKDVTDSPRLVLEIHNFIWPFKVRGRQAGAGPFGAVNFGAKDGEALSSFGLGLMIGVKQENGDRSFNLGVGYMWDQGVQVLGDGFEENMAPPNMEEMVRFKEETQGSLLVFVSTTF